MRSERGIFLYSMDLVALKILLDIKPSFMIKKIYNAAFKSNLVQNISSKNAFLLTWVILHHSPIITRANGSLNPDASEPIRDRAWYMCALT